MWCHLLLSNPGDLVSPGAKFCSSCGGAVVDPLAFPADPPAPTPAAVIRELSGGDKVAAAWRPPAGDDEDVHIIRIS